MSFTSLLRHTVDITRRMAVMDGDDPQLDDDGHTVTDEQVIATVRARIAPKTARELGWASQAGPVIADHTVFMKPTDINPADVIVHGTARYEVMVVNDAAGHGHHFEIDARRIVAPTYPAGEGS